MFGIIHIWASLRNSSDLSFYKHIQQIIANNAILSVGQEKDYYLISLWNIHMYICNTKFFRYFIILPFAFNTGFCARFSMTDRRIINDPALDCTKFVPPCPTRFPSNESFKCKLQSGYCIYFQEDITEFWYVCYCLIKMLEIALIWFVTDQMCYSHIKLPTASQSEK